MYNHLEQIVEIIPEQRNTSFARIRHGGTGRFDLVVVQYDMKELLVRPTLSRYLATEAAKTINQAFVSWLPDVMEDPDKCPTCDSSIIPRSDLTGKIVSYCPNGWHDHI